MILYFSGTGNTKLAAENLAILMKEKIHNIEQGTPPEISGQETLILAAPLYFWILPGFVMSYLSQNRDLSRKELHVVMTCGGALGAGASLIKRQLNQIGFERIFVYPLIMTTNYIPLHRVQSPDIAAKAIQSALARLPEIAENTRQKRSAAVSPLLEPVVEEAPAAVEEAAPVAEAAPAAAPAAAAAAPQTSDFGIIAVVASLVSLAGYAVSKKRR